MENVSWECHYTSWGGPWVPKGARDEKVSPRVVRWIPPPQEGPRSGPKIVTFFVWSLRDTKKGGPGGPSKIGALFDRFWGLPGGPQEGSRAHESSIFTFAAGPKKGSNMGAKMECFGLPNPNYTHFGAPFGRNRGRKSCIEKRVQNLGG